MSKPYTITPDGKVVDGQNRVLYEGGIPAEALQIAEFFNTGEYEAALERVLDENDKPPSGSEWQTIMSNAKANKYISE